MVTDRLARIGADGNQFYLDNKINSTWASFRHLQRFLGPHTFLEEIDAVSDCFQMNFEVERYGYGYGITSSTIRFGVTVLLIHATFVLIRIFYISYDLFFGRGWTSSVRGTVHEFSALAINSTPTGELRNTCAGVSRSETWGEISDSHLSLVLGIQKAVILGTVLQGKEHGDMPKLG